MNQDQISRIREDLLASNPELTKAGLTDLAIEKAAEKVLSKGDQVLADTKPESPAKDLEKPAESVFKETVGSSSPETSSEAPDTKAIMNAVLEDLQGNGQKFRIDNPDLASAVDQVLKMSRKE